jgi:glycosyltransferase involved in cell wall biosynthesis
MEQPAMRGHVVPFVDRAGPRASVSIVIPFFNEAPNLPGLIDALEGFVRDAADKWRLRFELIFVDDGSEDGGRELLEELGASRSAAMDMRILRLSRNFGKEVALTAGLSVVESDAVVLMDADLQHPVDVIEAFLAGWLTEGYDVVYAYHARTRPEAWWKRSARKLFYGVLGSRSEIRVNPDAGDFRLMSRRAYEALKQFGERQRLMKGLYGWIGFRQKAVAYVAPERLHGTSKFSPLKLCAMGIEGVTSFSVAPLRLAVWTGISLGVVSAAYGLWTVFEKLFVGVSVPGYPTIVFTISMIGAAQLIFLGVIGEYLGKVLTEVKGRPLYILESDNRFSSRPSASEEADHAGSGAVRVLVP